MPCLEEGHSIILVVAYCWPGQADNNNHSMHYKYTVNGNYSGDNFNKI